MVAQASAQEDVTSAQSGSSFERFGQSYIDANFLEYRSLEHPFFWEAILRLVLDAELGLLLV